MLSSFASQAPIAMTLRRKKIENIVGKGKILETSDFSFSLNFYLFQDKFYHLSLIWFAVFKCFQH